MQFDAGTDTRGIAAGLPAIIGAIGTAGFGRQLLALLNQSSGAEHCSVFEFGGDRLHPLGSASLDGTNTAHTQFTLYNEGQHWRQDPMLDRARRCADAAHPLLLHTSITDLPPGGLRDVIYAPTDIRERIIICGRQQRSAYGVSVLRSNRRGGFSAEEVTRLHTVSETLIAVLMKHVECVQRARSPGQSLTCLREIEATLTARAPALPRRESEVCARILYGLSTTGIALDIGVGEESVVTYRKRAFQRLGIATRRELLLWYLAN